MNRHDADSSIDHHTAALTPNERRGHALHMQDDGAARVLPVSPQQEEVKSAATPLEQFIAARGDEARLALGPDVLRAAYEEARDQHLVGWQTEINEYVYALESGKGLNRPMPEPSAAKPWWIVTTTDDAAALKEGWKEIARKWALLWPNGRQM